MSVDLVPRTIRTVLRRPQPQLPSPKATPASETKWPVARLVLIAVAFLVIGGASRDPGDDEARLGVAAAESFAPFGQVFGGWDPSLSPGAVIVSQYWAWMEGGFPSTGAIRWPSTLAAIGIGLLLSFRAIQVLGNRAGVLTGLCLMSSLALIDRTADFGVDALTGLAVVGALDRILNQAADWKAGLWAALAIALGGWPALAMILLPTVVLGRPGSSLSFKLLAPPLALFIGWSTWAIAKTGPELWAATVALPITRAPSFTLAAKVFAVALPWSPLAILAAWPSVRAGWDEKSRALVTGWLKVAVVCVLAGSIVPGLAIAAKVPILAALAIAAASGLDRTMNANAAAGPRRTLLGLAVMVSLAWGVIAVAGGGYLAAAASYYRALAFVLMGLGIVAALLSLNAAFSGVARTGFIALFLVAVGLKIAHWGYLVPEMNYRLGQGPWGRAIGQYVPPRWPVYTFHAWRADIAFASEHPFRQLPDERFLTHMPGTSPKFVLLLASEFENWSPDAPKLLKVRTFEDELGGTRVLARTEGPLLRRTTIDY